MDNNEGKQIFTLIPKIIGKIEAVAKDHTNKDQGYKFRSIDDVYNACNKALAEEKITIEVNYEVITSEVIKKANDKYVYFSKLKGIYKFFAPDGSHIQSSTIGTALDYSDKADNKAMSMAYKYVLFQTFIIPTEEQEDGDKDNIQFPDDQKRSTLLSDLKKKFALFEEVAKKVELVATDKDKAAINEIREGYKNGKVSFLLLHRSTNQLRIQYSQYLNKEVKK